MKVEFDVEEQKWRVIIPSRYNRSGKPEVKLFRDKKWANDVWPRIESVTEPSKRNKGKSAEERFSEIEQLIEALEKLDLKHEPGFDAELVLGPAEIAILESIYRAILNGQQVVLRYDT
jgi:hypothetical protein